MKNLPSIPPLQISFYEKIAYRVVGINITVTITWVWLIILFFTFKHQWIFPLHFKNVLIAESKNKMGNPESGIKWRNSWMIEIQMFDVLHLTLVLHYCNVYISDIPQQSNVFMNYIELSYLHSSHLLVLMIICWN